jgi:hypothetical protein
MNSAGVLPWRKMPTEAQDPVSGESEPTRQSHSCPVDGHVHFHVPALVGPTLDAAAANFRAVSGRSEGLLGAILLTQASAERVFEGLESSTNLAGWTFAPARHEPQTRIARQGTASVAVVCGRQVRAADGLEVLALGTVETFPDGLLFPDAVEAVYRSGALTAIPWGFGKWLGSRGQRVQSTLESHGPEALFVGDNGSRLDRLGAPALVRASEQRGFRVLPGTDPFPFAMDHRRVGRFGFLADVDLPETAPWRALRNWLLARRTSPTRYGRGCGPFQFVFNQVGIQVYNRLLRSRR